MSSRSLVQLTALAAAIPLAHTALAQTDGPSEPETRRMTRDEIEAWLDAAAVDQQRDIGVVKPASEAPPPAPRKHGLVVEGAVGGVFHLSALKHVSPTSPEFKISVGYEVIDPLLLFVDGGMFLSSTRYARPPPDPRTYAYYAFGGGARFSFDIAESFGLHIQGNAGMATATEDVLLIYGYTESTELNVYFGGQLGIEWFQVNPHYALALHAGVRDYLGLERELSSDAPLVIHTSAAIKYTF